MEGVGWSSLFWTVFKRSNNAMALIDERRCWVEVNGAFLRLVGHRKSDLVGHRAAGIVAGSRRTDREWFARLRGGDYFGEAQLTSADGRLISVHYAAHPELVTGRRLILYVALDTGRRGRARRRRRRSSDSDKTLTAREREIVRLVALGQTGPEIADELHIAHDTVRSHVRNAQDKLGARSRAQLVAVALAEGHAADRPAS